MFKWAQKVFNQIKYNSGGNYTIPQNFLDNYFDNFIRQNNWMPWDDQRNISNKPEYDSWYNWYPSDTILKFEENKRTSPELLKKFGWMTNDGNPTEIQYWINDWGFRCKNFSDKPGIAFFGCSMTFGVGLSEKDTFAYQVASHYNLENYNMGMPGKGLDFTALFALLKLPKLCPNLKAICIYLPPPGRRSIVTKITDADKNAATPYNYINLHALDYMHEDYLGDKNPGISHNELITNTPSTEAIYLNWLWRDENLLYNEISALAVYKTLANDLGIPLVIINQQDASWFPEHSDLARDLLHPGKTNNKLIAEQFLLQLELDK